jgi:hypothetical protein
MFTLLSHGCSTDPFTQYFFSKIQVNIPNLLLFAKHERIFFLRVRNPVAQPDNSISGKRRKHSFQSVNIDKKSNVYGIKQKAGRRTVFKIQEE